MHKVRVAGHVFEGIINTGCGPTRRDVAIVVSADTPFDILEELRVAKKLEQLNEDETLVELVFTLVSWSRMERVESNFHNGIAIYWHVLQTDEVDYLKEQITDLQEENRNLIDENNMLTDALLELAELIGNEET